MKLSIGGLFQAVLGTRVTLLSCKAVDAAVDSATDNDIANWLADMKAKRPTHGNPLNRRKRDKVVTLRLRLSTDEIRKLYRELDESGRLIHDEWLADRDVELAADLLKSDKDPLPF